MTDQNPNPGTGSGPGHDQVQHLLGAYLLGGLDHPDRLTVQAHLPGCATCRAELARHADLPGLLRLTSDPTQPLNAIPGQPEDGAVDLGSTAASIAVPDDLLDSLLDQVRHRRRTSRRGDLTQVLAAASVAAVLGAGITFAATRTTAQHTPTAVALPVTARTGFATTGTAALTAKPWGTSLTVDLTALPAGRTYLLQVTGPGGASQTAATWTGPFTGTVHLTGATSWTPSTLTAVKITDIAGHTVAATTQNA